MSLYSPARRAASALNGIGDMNDGSGTINPAALNSGGTFSLIGPRSSHLRRLAELPSRGRPWKVPSGHWERGRMALLTNRV